MLLELRIENLLLIERAELRLEPGLNAITGETGAGKTVLAHSLDLLMGGRARPQIVRPGAPEAYVEGVFAAPDGLLADPELAELAERLPLDRPEIVLARRVAAGGRTSAYVQGRSANVADLKALGARLLAFFGQHEHRRLAIAAAQLDLLDGFAGAAHLELRERYRSAHAEVGAIEREIAELRDRDGARERNLDLMRFELAEIEAASPDPAEREELARERERLRHTEALRAAAAAALGALASDDAEGGALAALAASEGALGGVDGIDAGLDGARERVAAAALELGDVASELRAYLDELDSEPGRLEALEERLAELERLERKHGGSLEAVLEHAARCRAEIARLENAEAHAGELERRLGEAVERRAALARELSAARRDAAPELERRVAAALAGLAMEGARLEVSFEPAPGGFAAAGAESVEMLVATNPGMPVAPLREAASGGELSRIMLALASACGAATAGSTLVFDEIDAGVGGATGRAVADRLRELSEAAQVLCITHLAQVASVAGANYTITKRVEGGATVAEVRRVKGEALVAEIARMLGGGEEADGAAARHARELLAA